MARAISDARHAGYDNSLWINVIDRSLEFFSRRLLGLRFAKVVHCAPMKRPTPKDIQLAALGLPSGVRADWRQWNSSAPATNSNPLATTFYLVATFVIASAYLFRANAEPQPDSSIWKKFK